MKKAVKRSFRLLTIMIVSIGLSQPSLISPATAAYTQPGKWSLVAAGLRSNVLATTSLNGTTLENGTYFYFSNNASMGFSPNSTVSLSSADTYNRTCTGDGIYRVSWHLSSTGAGGYRVGCDFALNSSTTAMKAVYQSNTLPSYYPSGIQQNVSASTITNGGWTLCFSADYATTIPANGSSITTPCTETYLMLAAFSSVVTPLSPPGAPTIGTATASSANSATVTFTAPASTGGSTITSYTATSTPGSLTGTINQSGSGVITVTGLSPNTNYTFQVTATNSDGTSTASANSNSILTPKNSPTVNLSTASKVLTYGTVTTVTASATEAGKITFKANGKKIPKCLKLSISTSVGCAWKPALHGVINLTVDFIPNSANSLPITTSLTVSARSRSNNR